MAANTFQLISSTILKSSSSSITFLSIPNTYTDLVLRSSARNTGSSGYGLMATYNSTTSGYSGTYIEGNGTIASGAWLSGSSSAQVGLLSLSTHTANTFSNNEIYIPNYNVSQQKPSFAWMTTENNASLSYGDFIANLWANTAAITSITLAPAASSFDVGSSFYLYGISKS